MIKETIKSPTYNSCAWQFKLWSGAGLGLINSTAVTPFINYTNHAINQRSNPNNNQSKFTFRRMFDGLASYNVSFVLRISVALSLDSYLLHQLSAYGEIDKHYKLLSSIVSGGIAGAVATLSEATAQTQQLTPSGQKKPSSITIAKAAYQANGFFALNRGMSAMIARSAGLTAGYLALMPPLCQYTRQEIGDYLISDVLAAMVCGLFVGIITTPPNNARFEKQKDFMKKGPAPSYVEIWKNQCATPEGSLNLSTGLHRSFAGFSPQTMRCMISMFILMEGNKLCNLYADEGFSDFLNFSSK